MKIGIFTDSYFPQVSGVATSIKTLKEALEKKGHEVYIFTTTDPNAVGIEKDIIRMPSVPFVSFKDRRIVVRGMLSAYYIAKELQLDFIHTQTEFGVGMLGKMVAHQLKIPCVHTYHTMYEDYLHYIAKGKILKPTHVKMMMRAFSKHLSGIVCPSMRVVDSLQRYGVKTPLRVIPTGINLDKFKGDETLIPLKKAEIFAKFGYDDNTLLLLSLSRLSYEKNIQEVIKGFVKIHEKLPQARLLIAGKGPYGEDLQTLAEGLGLEAVVSFAGEVATDEVPYYYKAADYFVSCSTSESQGLTYTEAMAAGVQCVVCGNEYIDSLFSDLAFGQTFSHPDEFAETFLAYYDLQVPRDLEKVAEKLYPMSADKFGEEVLTFYGDATDFFLENILVEGKYNPKLLKRPKILRKKVKDEI